MTWKRAIAAACAALVVASGCAVSRDAGQGAVDTALPVPSDSPTSAPSSEAPASAAPSAEAPTAAPTTGPTAPTPTTPTPAESTPTPAESTPEEPSVELVFQQGQVSPEVRELQARLRQEGLFSLYDLSNVYGPITAQGVSNFQKASTLPVTGQVDTDTWDTLVAATKAPTPEELNNQIPGDPLLSPQSKQKYRLELQHRLRQGGYFKGAIDGVWKNATTAAVKAFQTAQKIPVTGQVDQRTWDRLNATTRTPTPWELGIGEAPRGGQKLDKRCLTGRVLCASMSQNKMSWVVDGEVLLTLDVRYGSSEWPTLPGKFHVWHKNKEAESTLFSDEPIPMPYAIFFDQARAVHFAEAFAVEGWNGTSHGCINTRDLEKQKWLFNEVRLGDTVVIY